MDKTVFYRQFSSPLGKLLLTSDGQSLTGLFMTKLADGWPPKSPATGGRTMHPSARPARS